MKSQNETFGHPRGLSFLFLTEMWERFSYYGMRALLVLYMTQFLFKEIRSGQAIWGFDFLQTTMSNIFGPMTDQALSSQIYGLYTGLVYLTPLFGGYLADRYLGARKAVYTGGILMAIGHLLMASAYYFLPALFFLILGNGFFKPNLSAQVGGLYAPGDSRRDSAFTIYYMGVNLGAFFSPLVCGTLGQKYGWHYGFGAAGIGMIVGLFVYHAGRKHMPPELPRTRSNQSKDESLNPGDMKKIFALIFLCVINILFWGVYEQQGNSLQIWADQKTDWSLGSFIIPSTWFQSLNPFFIFALTPLITKFWTWQARKSNEPSSVGKMAIGCFLAGAGYLVMVASMQQHGAGEKLHWLWLIAPVLLFTIGELYLSPIGLSLVTKLAPAKMVSMLMGLWFLSSFFGNYLAGFLGSFMEPMGDQNFFLMIAGLAGLGCLLFVLTLKPLKKIITS